MNILDMKTLVLNQILTYVVCMIVVGLLWQQNRQRFSGIGLWLTCFIMQTISIVLIALRGVIPNWLSIVGGGSMIPMGATILLYIGLEQFFSLRSRQFHNVILWLGTGAVHAYFTFVQLSLAARNVNFSIAAIIIYFQIAWLMLRRVRPEMRPITGKVGWVFIAFSILSVGRIFVNLTEPAGNDFLKANSTFDTLLVLAYQVLFFAVAFGLFLMINQRLFWDLREQQSALQKSEARYRQLVEFSPNAIFVFHAGRFILVNSAAARLMRASSPEQLIGCEILDFVHPDYRAIVNQRLENVISKGETAPLLEEKFIRMDGTVINVEVTTAPLDFQGQSAFQSIVRDITERKQSENIIHARVRTSEFAAKHSLSELLQNTLDELCDLTDSPIGFFHFVEPDQRTISLQAWSTRTLAEFCHAEGRGHHYDIGLAGVWVDCIRLGAPVIYNDYASLPHRKGLPEGHAPVVRVMIFPIIREEKIVAVIGVGNRAADYTETDIAYASRLADMIWDITERKRMESELERLATTDSLTGVLNRRELVRRAEIELERARRHQHPISIIMMDIDHFKGVNDAYGHTAGDKVLVSLAQLLTSEVRTFDLVGRFGGEEFVLLLPETTTLHAQDIAERIRHTVAATSLIVGGETICFTISLGVTSSESSGHDFKSLLDEADRLMYQAKRLGRNQVVASLTGENS
jgi:diguanylate cyclase (GGDEF)-like protein/PAS domain S-box-containing protein